MHKELDTQGVCTNTPFDDVYERMVFNERLICYEGDLTSRDEVYCSGDLNAVANAKEEEFETSLPVSFFQYIGNGARKLSRNMMTAVIASHIDITRLSSDGNTTGHIDINPVVRLMQRYNDRSVSISPSLIMRRDRMRASSLLAPSGAHLAWIELVENEEGDD